MDFVLKHWRIFAVVILLAGAFIGGRYTAQGRVQYVEKEKIVEKQIIVAGKDTRTIEYRDRIITRVVVKKPDGTVTETTVDKDAGHSDKNEHETKTVTIEKIVEREKIVKVGPPDWRVGILVGATATKWDKLPTLGTPYLAVGVEVDRRIIGPFSLGVWGLSSGAAGVAISGEF